MYITYSTAQYHLKGVDTTDASGPYLEPPERFSKLPNTEYKPTHLVRVSDMKVIQGSKVDEGYCTLSYSWNQSGYIIKNGEESVRIDEGKHKIIARETKLWGILGHLSRKTRFVKFEGLIQQICLDFGVNYIWYDQMCINQSNPEEKKRELRQMHRIYSHAYCAVALVPELRVVFLPLIGAAPITQDMPNAEWMKRLWTLEEAYLSKQILFVGQNAHMWSRCCRIKRKEFGYIEEYELDSLCDKSIPWNASTALRHSRTRTSTKSHDRIFAISNIFPSIADDISFSYNQPLLDLVIQVHILLAKKDISILCFGSPNQALKASIVHHAEDKHLPSWTGVTGIHAQKTESNGGGNPTFSNYDIVGTSMHITCSYIPACKAERDSKGAWRLSFPYPIGSFIYHQEPEPTIHLTNNTITYAAFVNPKKENSSYRLHRDFAWENTYAIPLKSVFRRGYINTQRRLRSKRVGGILSVTEECTSCIILSGVSFNTRLPGIKIYPVIKQCGDHYKAVGSCTMPNLGFFDPGVEQPEKTFIIK